MLPKRIVTLVVLVIGFTDCYCQTLTLSDLLSITKLSHKEAVQYLTTDKYFAVLSSVTVYHNTISQFKKASAGVEELVIKSQWEDNGRTVASVHYDIKPKSYVGIIIKELQVSNFKLVKKEDDARKQVRLYDNDSFMLSIYTFEDKNLPVSIDVHEK